jgi:nucleoside-diphosphate kinase
LNLFTQCIHIVALFFLEFYFYTTFKKLYFSIDSKDMQMIVKKAALGIIIIILIALAAIFMSKDISQKQLYSPTIAPSAPSRTLALIKPDAVTAKNSGKIIDMIEYNNFNIVAIKKLFLSKEQAEQFYAAHNQKSFYPELISYITSGPVIALILEKEHAVESWRDLIGATDPAQAAPGTIRKIFGASKTRNAVHGSDSQKTAQEEIAFFFPELKTQNKE